MVRRWQGAGAVVVALALLAGPAAAQEQAPLTLTEAYALARSQNPTVQAALARVEATAALESAAGLPPDPVLQLGVMNLALPGLDATMPASMAPSLQATQRVPFPGKLGLSERIAEQGTAIAAASAEETWWGVRATTARAWYDVYEADRKLAVMRETAGLLRDFHEVARSMYASGTGRQTDVLRASVEVARMDAEIERMATMREVAVARLNAVLDRPAGSPVGELSLPAMPATLPGVDTLIAWADASRPLLAAARTRLEQADTRGALADRQIWPDFSVGLQYGQRPTTTGTAHMGSAMVGFSVPVFAGGRQLQLREEAAALEAAAAAELRAAGAEVGASMQTRLAELRRARTLLDLYDREILPQADANVESSFSSYRVGSVDFMTLVDAQMATNRYAQEYHELLADYGRTVAELERTLGREIPVTTDTLAEADRR